jgi:alpha/beta superfamily hydrolase
MSSISNRLHTLSVPGPAGSLEALLFEGQPDARYAALVCHPHPLGGGTMHNKVVYRAAKTMQSLGLPTLRFNFRGTGLSEGQHDEGRGERDDVRAALDWLHHRYALPILVVGFSFGANVALRTCCHDVRDDADAPRSHARVPGFAALGLPVAAEGREYSYDFLASCTLPKLFISGGADQYGPQATLVRIVASAAQPATLVIVPDADHFFAGKLDQMQHALHEWLVSNFFAGADAAQTP